MDSCRIILRNVMFCKLTLVLFRLGKNGTLRHMISKRLALKGCFFKHRLYHRRRHISTIKASPSTSHLLPQLARSYPSQASQHSASRLHRQRWPTTSPPFLAQSRIRQVRTNHFCLESVTNMVHRSIVRSITRSAPAVMATAARENTSSRRTHKPFSCPTSTRTRPTTPRTR
jgi:hypothetical protein